MTVEISVAVEHKCIYGFSKTCPSPVAGYGPHQPIHRRRLLPCGEEHGVVAGGYLVPQNETKKVTPMLVEITTAILQQRGALWLHRFILTDKFLLFCANW